MFIISINSLIRRVERTVAALEKFAERKLKIAEAHALNAADIVRKQAEAERDAERANKFASKLRTLLD